MIKYEFAFTCEGIPIHISKVSAKNRNQKFICISCKKPLTAKLGKIKKHHFAHKNKSSCNKETYLHRIAKYLFYNYYLKSLNSGEPFTIEYQKTYVCSHATVSDHKFCSTVKEEPYDLTKTFTEVKLEGQYGTFRPDVLLLDPENDIPIFVEFVVKNRISIEKKNSGHRIIEFKIDSLKDVESFINCYVKFDYIKIDHHNFLDKQKAIALCYGWCKMKPKPTLNKPRRKRRR
ncbi:MAG: competence protein CoiA family protein [Balneola sp.]